jgi:Cdc6-like AAA superfamily ATPase
MTGSRNRIAAIENQRAKPAVRPDRCSQPALALVPPVVVASKDGTARARTEICRIGGQLAAVAHRETAARCFRYCPAI